MLFSHFLVAQLPKRDSGELVTTEDFTRALKTAKDRLKSLVYGEDVNFFELKQAGERLSEKKVRDLADCVL